MDNLYFFVTAVTAFFALIVIIGVVIFAISYRDGTGNRVGAPITGSIPLELGWSIIPFPFLDGHLRMGDARVLPSRART